MWKEHKVHHRAHRSGGPATSTYTQEALDAPLPGLTSVRPGSELLASGVGQDAPPPPFPPLPLPLPLPWAFLGSLVAWSTAWPQLSNAFSTLPALRASLPL